MLHPQRRSSSAGKDKQSAVRLQFSDIARLVLPRHLKSIHWSVLDGMGTSIHVMEVMSPELQVDLSGYWSRNQMMYDVPLLLIRSSPSVEKFASRFNKNYFTDYVKDESGIIWSSDRKTLIDFPANLVMKTYHLPAGTEHIFRWAFNDKRTVQEIIASSPVNLIGDTAGGNFCRFENKSQIAPVTLSLRETLTIPQSTL